MKISAAMLKGYAAIGRQCSGDYCEGEPTAPTAVCAVGAANFAFFGDATSSAGDNKPGWTAFTESYGETVADANDRGLPIDVIAGMLRAIGH